MNTVQGRIVSTNLGEFSKKGIVYGFIGVERSDKTVVKIKIDSYTEHETLHIGDEVEVEVHNLENTDILVARAIHLKSSTDMGLEEAHAAV
ncbi:MAG: hypothetical protein ACFFCP_13810 [Promethearchaeota archaeon]